MPDPKDYSSSKTIYEHALEVKLKPVIPVKEEEVKAETEEKEKESEEVEMKEESAAAEDVADGEASEKMVIFIFIQFSDSFGATTYSDFSECLKSWSPVFRHKNSLRCLICKKTA